MPPPHPGPPPHSGARHAVTTETDAHLSFLEQQCAQLRLTALDLTDEQARNTPTVSALSISGLLTHGAQVVYGWLQQVRDPSLVATEDDYAQFNAALGLDGAFDGGTLPDLDIAEVLAVFDRASPRSRRRGRTSPNAASTSMRGCRWPTRGCRRTSP